MYRYYSTQRPVGPGTFPGRPENIVNFDSREEVPGIGPGWCAGCRRHPQHGSDRPQHLLI